MRSPRKERSSRRPGDYPPEVKEVLRDGYPEMPYIIEVDPPLHDRIRGLITRAFTPRRIGELEPRVSAISHELVESFAPEGEADIVERFAWPLPLRVLGELFGVPRADLEQLHQWGTDWLLVQQELPVERRVQHARGLVQMQHYFVDLVEERIRTPADDLISALVLARDQVDPPLDAVEIAGLPLDLMVAGHVTVTRAIGSTLNRLFSYPPLRDHLLDPAVASKAIEEVLRLEAPAQGLFRITSSEVEIGGVTLPRGARVMAHFASANRDNCVFARPDDYDPERSEISEARRIRQGDPLLHRRTARATRAGNCAPDAAAPAAEPARKRCRRARGDLLRTRLSQPPGRMGHSVSVVIVTGAAGGLGRVYCRALPMPATTSSPPTSRRPSSRRRCRRRVDVTDRSSTEQLAAAALERFGAIDALVNNAAYYTAIVKQPFEEITDEEWIAVLRRQRSRQRGSAAAPSRRR